MDKIFNLEHVFDKDFGPFFRKFWGFGGFLGPVNKKEGKAFHCAQYIFYFWSVVCAMQWTQVLVGFSLLGASTFMLIS